MRQRVRGRALVHRVWKGLAATADARGANRRHSRIKRGKTGRPNRPHHPPGHHPAPTDVLRHNRPYFQVPGISN